MRNSLKIFAVMGAVVIPTALRADVTNGLVTRYSFEEGAGTVVNDVSGNGHHADLSGATWTAGKIGGGLEFDGSNDVVEDLGAGAYLNGLSAVTVCVWVKSDVTNQDRGIFFTRNPNGQDQELGLRYDRAGWGGGANDNIKASIRTDQDYTQVETISDVQTTAWQFLAFVWEDGQTIALYIDAQPVGLTYDEGPVSGQTSGVQRLMIGRCTKNRYWDGKMDDFRIYDRALSQGEILEIYRLGLGGLVAYYRFDDGTGQVASDSSGSDHHGTLGSSTGVDTNDPSWVAGKCDGALYFDGVDDYVEVPHSDDFLMDQGTIACWLTTTSPSQYQGVVTKDSRNFDTGGHIRLYVQGNKVRARLQSVGDSYSLTSGNISSNTWHHAAFTFGPAGMKLYLDGAEVDSDPYTGGTGTTSGGAGNYEPWAIGVDTDRSGDGTLAGWDRPFSGVIDEVRIYARALAPDEIAQIMACEEPTSTFRIFQWREVSR